MVKRCSLQVALSTDHFVAFDAQDQLTIELHSYPTSKASADLSLVVVDAVPPAAPASESARSTPTGLFGCYELLDKLGSGGSGSVYKARHTMLDRLVALKVLAPRLLSNARALDRFKLEMKAIGKLEHPHIVRALDAGDFDGMYYLAMEYVDGQDLSRLVQRQGRLSVGQACRLLQQAAIGLAYAHRQGLVHRDIKPANLL